MLAMTWYDWFKAGHVLVAVLWVGGGATLALLAIMTLRLKDPLQVARFAHQAGKIGELLYTPASLLVLLFGIGLMTNDQSPGTGTCSGSRSRSQVGADVPRRVLLDPANGGEAREDDRGEGPRRPRDAGDHQAHPASDADRRADPALHRLRHDRQALVVAVIAQYATFAAATDTAGAAQTRSPRHAAGKAAPPERKAKRARDEWARLGSNQRPLACEASALPLSYAPGRTTVYDGRRPSSCPVALGGELAVP